MIKINLVPADILAKARQRQLLLQASLAGGVFVVILVVVSFFHWFGLNRLQSQLAYDEAELKRLDAIVKQVEELEKAANAVRSRLGVIDDLLRGRSFYPLFMSEFARTVPGGVQINSMMTASVGGSGLKLTIAATANSNEDIAAWVRALENNIAHFSSTELGGVAASGERYGFTLATSYKGN